MIIDQSFRPTVLALKSSDIAGAIVGGLLF